ncbi:ABC transporter ATP-binding protein [Micromonospora sp. NPDC023956]|uniref:ABC transporter ATP-binding protein n=1 Tax=Micromonospora sp. NPDC023956 TaxID=3155722 RepID=UPI0033FB513E
MSRGDAVEICDLTRVYRGVRGEPRTALDRLTLSIGRGEIHGLLGPNGAGKTTLCKILSTVLLPTSGTARVDGHDVVTETAAARRRIGIAFGGERGLYGRLTARQNLMYWSALYRQPTAAAKVRVAGLLERVGLADRAGERVETFSRGMKQRLHLARGLVGDPQVVILDEPTVGMDPVAAREFRVLVGEVRAEGRTVLLTTHDMAEAEAVCDRVSLVDGGRLVTTEDPRTIGGWLSTYERVTAEDVPPVTVELLRTLSGVVSVGTLPSGAVRVETDAPGAAREVLRILVDAGVTRLATGRPSLEEVYLHVVGDRGLEIR